jgi:hypothetical protein
MKDGRGVGAEGSDDTRDPANGTTGQSRSRRAVAVGMSALARDDPPARPPPLAVGAITASTAAVATVERTSGRLGAGKV